VTLVVFLEHMVHVLVSDTLSIPVWFGLAKLTSNKKKRFLFSKAFLPCFSVPFPACACDDQTFRVSRKIWKLVFSC
jgi:hypothetical protein